MGIRVRAIDTAPSSRAIVAQDDHSTEYDRLLVASVGDHAIFFLAPDGTVSTWNAGAQRLKGYRAADIVGRHFRIFYPPEDIEAGKPERQLVDALRDGVLVDNGWRVAQNGTRFWAHVVISPIYDGAVLRGFAKVTRDDSAARAAMDSKRAITDFTRALLEGADVTDVLAALAAHARWLTGSGGVWLATPNESGLLVRAANGTQRGPPVGAELPNDPVVTSVMSLAEPKYLADLPASCPRLADLGMNGPGVLVPIVAGTGAIGILIAAARPGGSSFRRDALELFQAFAQQAALVLTYEQSQLALRERQVGDDRERIARDLHDHVIQQLFGTGMGLQSAAGHVQNVGLRTRIEEAVDHLDDTIRQIRTTIFDLHQTDLCALGTTRAQIAELVHDASRALAFQPVLHFEGAIDTIAGQQLCEQVLAALREMLSNVARHAEANAVTVSVKVTDTLVVTVTDDGIGPPADAQPGSGLRNLQARAKFLNGTFTFAAAPCCGAVATLRIPI